MSFEIPDRCRACAVAPDCPFRVLPDESRAWLHAAMEARRYVPDSALFHQGDAADGLYVVRSGAVRLVHLNADGRAMVVQLVTTSAILGLVEAVTGDRRLLTAQALEESLVDFLPRQAFVRLLLDHSKVAVELLIRVAQELADLQERMCEATESPLKERLLHRLQELAGLCGVTTPGGILLDLPLTVQALADSLGCTRQWASRLLADLQRDGLIVRRGRRLEITRAALRPSDSLHIRADLPPSATSARPSIC